MNAERYNFIITFILYGKSGEIIKSSKMRVKNRFSSLDAKIKLEGFLRRKYSNFGRLIVHDCKIDSPDMFKDIFADIFHF